MRSKKKVRHKEDAYDTDFNIVPLIRGFYPKGRGEVIVSCSPIKKLLPVELTDRGSLKKIRIMAFTAGAVPKKV